MGVPFFDDLEATPLDGLTCLVEVERVYSLDWEQFGEGDHQALSRIYTLMPGFVGDQDVLTWFGDDEDLPPFLGAVREPAGLRVRGILPEADWWAWDARFRREAAELPCRGQES